MMEDMLQLGACEPLHVVHAMKFPQRIQSMDFWWFSHWGGGGFFCLIVAFSREALSFSALSIVFVVGLS